MVGAQCLQLLQLVSVDVEGSIVAARIHESPKARDPVEVFFLRPNCHFFKAVPGTG